jgi:hypothetical protein
MVPLIIASFAPTFHLQKLVGVPIILFLEPPAKYVIVLVQFFSAVSALTIPFPIINAITA